MISKDYLYNYDSTYWPDFETGSNMEWVITNGLGGYGGGSLIGGKNRTHQGYLIASLHPPVRRYVLLEGISEWISIGGVTYDLETSRHRVNGGSVFKEGQKFLRNVRYDGTIRFEYVIGDPITGEDIFLLTKTIGQKHNENTVVVAYEFENMTDLNATIILTPMFNYREHNTLTTCNELKFDYLLTGDTLSLVPDDNPQLRIDFSVSEGDYYELSNKFDLDYELITEVELETEGLCSHYMPYEISIEVGHKSKKKLSAICSAITDEGCLGEALLNQASDAFVGPSSAEKLIEQIRLRNKSLYRDIEASNPHMAKDNFVRKLILDADHFIAKRESTGTQTILAGLPWFTDWGRDTMISFTGLTLCTKRYSEAKEILWTFAKYVKNGMVPNMFPDDGEEPFYNTVDASLWYFYAVYKFLEYIHADEVLLGKDVIEEYETFVKTDIYPVLELIISAYEKGTDFSIYMEDNGLIHAGSNLDQVTWMDVRVGELVVTPRHGCPVEISALWYNALKIMAKLSMDYSKDKDDQYFKIFEHCDRLSEKVQLSFESEFWNEELSCLYDVVDTSGKDASIRPNQIYAVALPFSLLPKSMEKAIVDKVYDCLYVGCGIRSLSTDHADYHGQYRGALEKRDLSYHQGTAWGFLLGGFISAYVKVYSEDENIYDNLMKLLKPVIHHQQSANCIGGICEIFEGDEPHTGRGCYTQAWSTGEILRAYVEDVLPLKGK